MGLKGEPGTAGETGVFCHQEWSHMISEKREPTALQSELQIIQR